MRKRSAPFDVRTLRLCNLQETFEHVEHLMALANADVAGAREIAELTLDGYFERIDNA